RFHGGIVGHDHAAAAGYHAHAGDHTTGRTPTRLGILPETGPDAEFLERSMGVDELGDPFAGRFFAFGVFRFDAVRAATLPDRIQHVVPWIHTLKICLSSVPCVLCSCC